MQVSTGSQGFSGMRLAVTLGACGVLSIVFAVRLLLEKSEGFWRLASIVVATAAIVTGILALAMIPLVDLDYRR